MILNWAGIRASARGGDWPFADGGGRACSQFAASPSESSLRVKSVQRKAKGLRTSSRVQDRCMAAIKPRHLSLRAADRGRPRRGGCTLRRQRGCASRACASLRRRPLSRGTNSQQQRCVPHCKPIDKLHIPRPTRHLILIHQTLRARPPQRSPAARLARCAAFKAAALPLGAP